MTISDLITIAAHAAHIRPEDVTGQCRRRQFAWPRQWVMFEAAQLGNPTTKIGRELHRDHTTVIYGIRRERDRRAA